MTKFAQEDHTVRMVREAATTTFQACDNKTREQWNSCWDGACLAIGTKMKTEGLTTTAETVLEMQGKARKFK